MKCFSFLRSGRKSPARDVVVVFALEEEAQGHFDDYDVLYSGVGKVNAAYRLTRSLALRFRNKQNKPKLILNLGSAGSPHFKSGVIVNCTRFIQRDFDATALGSAPYTTPYENTPAVLTNGVRYPDFPDGICGTGDNFSTNGHTPEWTVVDMEAYALAKICFLENISFACLKYITDGADGQAASSWEAGLPKTSEKLRDAMSSLLG
ncbi:MAG: 5'-nucleosidase [Bdellovibrionales bacterium]|jgi:adenosylhomocysteine nucleosidase